MSKGDPTFFLEIAGQGLALMPLGSLFDADPHATSKERYRYLRMVVESHFYPLHLSVNAPAYKVAALRIGLIFLATVRSGTDNNKCADAWIGCVRSRQQQRRARGWCLTRSLLLG